MAESEQNIPNGASYEASGVSTDRAAEGLRRITDRIRGTWTVAAGTGRVALPLGQYANVIEVAGQGIAFSTDGVGSKALIAQMLGKYDTIGIDCVAMNVNDIICVGARPVSMVDYIAIETAVPQMLEDIAIGLAEGARQAEISISGGEIAQLPGMIHGADGHGFDLVGTAIGHVGLDAILVGDAIEPGDVIIGVSSTGVHSNGLTLARKVLFDTCGFSLERHFDDLGCTLGEELIKPTGIYVREAMQVRDTVPGLKAMVHVTSDGFWNLKRMRATVKYVIDALPDTPPIFDLIQRSGGVTDDEMYHVYNMGIGFCFVVSEAGAEATLDILRTHGRTATRIGRVEPSAETLVSIPARGLEGPR